MSLYTYSEARQKLASLLDQAVREGQVCIRRRDGQMFVIRPVSSGQSPLDVAGVDLGVPTAEIVQMIREGRSTYRGRPRHEQL